MKRRFLFAILLLTSCKPINVPVVTDICDELAKGPNAAEIAAIAAQYGVVPEVIIALFDAACLPFENQGSAVANAEGLAAIRNYGKLHVLMSIDGGVRP